MFRFRFLLFWLFALGPVASFAQDWQVTKNGSLIQIGFGSGTNFPEIMVIDTASSYYRLNTGPGCGWGTSICLWPCYWSGGALYQGGPVASYTYSLSIRGRSSVINIVPNLQLSLQGTVGALTCTATIVLSPPQAHSLTASVTESILGNPSIDNRPNEAYKPIFFSSMNDSATIWDSYSLLTDVGLTWYPSGGFILSTPQTSSTILVTGGNSSWKTNAPTMKAVLKTPMPITGYVTTDTNPNDDNVGVWAASTSILNSFSYSLTATSN